MWFPPTSRSSSGPGQRRLYLVRTLAHFVPSVIICSTVIPLLVVLCSLRNLQAHCMALERLGFTRFRRSRTLTALLPTDKLLHNFRMPAALLASLVMLY